MTGLLDDVNALISKGVGDPSRLEHIKQTIENNKELYSSDRNYVYDLIKNHLLSKDKKVRNQKFHHQIIMLKMRLKHKKLFVASVVLN